METQTVFVVETDEDSLTLLGELLEMEGLSPRLFRRAEDAAQALAAAAQPPGLLLLDTMLPGTPAAALLQTLRSDARWSNIRAIVFTAWNDVSTRGAVGISVIPKPDVRALLSGIADSRSSGPFQRQRQREHASLSREIARPD